MAQQQWALSQLSDLLPLEESDLKQIITYTEPLSDEEAATHLQGLLGDSPQAAEFISSFIARRGGGEHQDTAKRDHHGQADTHGAHPPTSPPKDAPQDDFKLEDEFKKLQQQNGTEDHSKPNGSGDAAKPTGSTNGQRSNYAPPSYPAPTNIARASTSRHTNPVIQAAHVRARDEQEMQQALQNLQFQYNIYNSEIEPEHETEYPCSCPIHQYKYRKWARYGVQEMWSNAVMYPGEKSYNDRYNNTMFGSNPYSLRVISPYGRFNNQWGPQRPIPKYHAQMIHQSISLNNSLNAKAQASVDSKEPQVNIWDYGGLDREMSNLDLGSKEKASRVQTSSSNSGQNSGKPQKSSGFKKLMGMKSSEEKATEKGQGLKNAILQEEQGRWPDEQWRQIVANYQEKVGMKKKIADLRQHYPIQYLHLLRAGYFEPIPVAWANQASNPLKFSIEASAGWRGLTPAWRGYEDTAEERLYWVLNHREGSVGMRMKPDFISEMNMARARMATAVEPPPLYFSASDTCHIQHTSEGYSKQVMPRPFQPYDRPERPTDDTMILLDVSGSMDFVPVRPDYNQYLITGYSRSTQPKNKDVAKAIIRRFADAMANHDHLASGYDLTTFSSSASYIGSINHKNLDSMWRKIRVGGGTRVMTGWQKVKEMHFQKHSESATHHPIYGWQAGPETPMLRLLLLLDGEATDMDEFELDLLGLSWAHVTIFLIGVDGCPHHHRHANELQRISDVNHHVSFVDAQGNTPERFVTHELLKRHLGYDMPMQEFESLEELPPYSV